MPTHDIIDNRNEKLVKHISQILSSTESAKFAVGYFFLSGLEAIQKNLAEMNGDPCKTKLQDRLERVKQGERDLYF